MSTIAARRRTLDTTRQELEQRLRDIRRDRQHRGSPLEPDFAVALVRTANDEVLERLEGAAGWHLEQVVHALAHIDRGLGNRCASCAQSIGPRRLAAMAYATRCLSCTLRAPTPECTRMAGRSSPSI